MPKAKADKVVIHRIEFQEHERELLDLMAVSYSINKIFKPLMNLSLYSAVMITSILGIIAAEGFVSNLVDELQKLDDPNVRGGVKTGIKQGIKEFIINFERGVRMMP